MQRESTDTHHTFLAYQYLSLSLPLHRPSCFAIFRKSSISDTTFSAHSTHRFNSDDFGLYLSISSIKSAVPKELKSRLTTLLQSSDSSFPHLMHHPLRWIGETSPPFESIITKSVYSLDVLLTNSIFPVTPQIDSFRKVFAPF